MLEHTLCGGTRIYQNDIIRLNELAGLQTDCLLAAGHALSLVVNEIVLLYLRAILVIIQNCNAIDNGGISLRGQLVQISAYGHIRDSDFRGKCAYGFTYSVCQDGENTADTLGLVLHISLLLF